MMLYLWQIDLIRRSAWQGASHWLGLYHLHHSHPPQIMAAQVITPTTTSSCCIYLALPGVLICVDCMCMCSDFKPSSLSFPSPPLFFFFFLLFFFFFPSPPPPPPPPTHPAGVDGYGFLEAWGKAWCLTIFSSSSLTSPLIA